MFPLLFLIALPMSVKCAGLLMCNSDTDCQDGYSCTENICKICVKCSLIFRKGNNCESDFNDCGDCLEGYKEISVTDNSAVKKPCKPIKKKLHLRECVTDSHCPPKNYCSEKSCVNCFDCSLINRLAPEKCAKVPDECGPCFIGYLSIQGKRRTNSSKCEKVPPEPVPHKIESASVSLACIMAIIVGVLVIKFVIKNYGGSESYKTIFPAAEPSAPPELMQELCNECQLISHNVKLCNEHQFVGQRGPSPTRQELQQAKVFQQPWADYYPTEDIISEGISEIDSRQNETSNVPDQTTSAQREESCGECARSVSLSEVNSINSDSNSQHEQSDDVNLLNNDSAQDNSQLVTEDPDEVPEDPAKEPTEDCH